MRTSGRAASAPNRSISLPRRLLPARPPLAGPADRRRGREGKRYPGLGNLLGVSPPRARGRDSKNRDAPIFESVASPRARVAERMDEKRKAGELAKPPAGPGRGKKGKTRRDQTPEFSPPTLASQGVDKDLAKRARKAAAMTEEGALALDPHQGRGEKGVEASTSFRAGVGCRTAGRRPAADSPAPAATRPCSRSSRSGRRRAR